MELFLESDDVAKYPPFVRNSCFCGDQFVVMSVLKARQTVDFHFYRRRTNERWEIEFRWRLPGPGRPWPKFRLRKSGDLLAWRTEGPFSAHLVGPNRKEVVLENTDFLAAVAIQLEDSEVAWATLDANTGDLHLWDRDLNLLAQAGAVSHDCRSLCYLEDPVRGQLLIFVRLAGGMSMDRLPNGFQNFGPLEIRGT